MQKDHSTTSPKTTRQAHAPSSLSGKAFLFKTCRTCGEEKPLRRFYTQRGCRETHRIDCIQCVRVEARVARTIERATKRPSRRCVHCRETLSVDDFIADRRCFTGHRRTCKRCERLIDKEREARHEEELEMPDFLIPQYTELREQRIDLGLAIAHTTCPPGHCRTREEIAAYTGLTKEAVRRIELRALWKMRQRARELLAALGLEDLVEEGIPQ